jgi:hypothetical protein
MYESACFVEMASKVLPAELPSDLGHVCVHAKTVLPKSSWQRTGEVKPGPVIKKPPEEALKVPVILPELLNVPFGFIVSMSLCNHGAPGPVTMAVKFHVPARSATVGPEAADANEESRHVVQMKMNSPYIGFNPFAPRISGPPRSCDKGQVKENHF